MPNPIVHWELNADDAGKAQDFFAEMFDWHVDTNNPVNYGLVDTHTDNGIGGGIHHDDDAPKGISFM